MWSSHTTVYSYQTRKQIVAAGAAIAAVTAVAAVTTSAASVVTTLKHC
jgi:hypothetical protein